MATLYLGQGLKDRIMKIEKVPIYLLLMFTAVYMLIGTGSAIWSGLYFISNYLILAILFLGQKDKWIRVLGTSVSISILLFSVLKFFVSSDQDTLFYPNVVIFLLIAFGIYKLEPK